MKKIVVIIIGIATVLLSISISTRAQTYFSVDVKGKGKPMILVHGLYCNGDVWKETVAHYQKNYECHIITVAGFGGNNPNLNDHFLESVKDDIIVYVKKNKLNKPVIVGHSMGGFLAFWAAASAPGLFDRVVAVDGVPFMPALQADGATVEGSKAMATNIKNGMANQTPEQTLGSQKMYLPTMITSKERVDEVAAIAVRADSKTQAEVMYEMFTTDLRKEVASIDCPVLLLGAWIAYKDYGFTQEMAVVRYKAQVTNVKNAIVEISPSAKHFIFYDDPAWFYNKVDAFLK